MVGAATVRARGRRAVRGRHVSRRVGAVPDADPAVPPRAQRRHHPHADPARGRGAAAVAVRGGAPLRRDSEGAARAARARTPAVGVVPRVRWRSPNRRASGRRGEARPRARSPSQARCARRRPTCRSASRSSANARRARHPRSRRGCAHDLFARLEVTPGFNAVRVAGRSSTTSRCGPTSCSPSCASPSSTTAPAGSGSSMSAGARMSTGARTACCGSAGWEVVRIRTGRLEKLGPYDLQLSGTGRKTVARLLEVFGEIRGQLIVESYRR